MLRSPDLIEQWRVTQQAYLADTPTVMAYQALDQRRLHMQQEMRQLLDAFLNRAITLKEFNTTFQQQTQGAWNVFRMRGTSGVEKVSGICRNLPTISSGLLLSKK